MSCGYIGDTFTSVKQQVKNKGILTTQESFDLERQGFLGGSLELIESQTVSEVTSVTFSNIKEDVYDVHLFTGTIDDTSTGTVGRGNKIQFFESGVLETASVYEYAIQFGRDNGTFSEARGSDSQIRLGGFDNDIISTNFHCYLYDLGNSNKMSFCTFETYENFDPLGTFMSFGGGILKQSSTVDGIKYFLNTTDTFTGTLKIFGLKQ